VTEVSPAGDGMTLVVGGTKYAIVEIVLNPDSLPLLRTKHGREFFAARDGQHASETAVEKVNALSESDPTAILVAVNDDSAIVEWLFGNSAFVGQEQYDSLSDWINRYYGEHPELVFLGDDGDYSPAVPSRVSAELVEALGYTPTLVYRWL
jgi:hypothetical protein